MGDEKAADEESHRPLLGEAAGTVAHPVSTRERVTRWLLLVVLLTNFYAWWSFSSVSHEQSKLLGLGQFKKREDWAHAAAEIAENLATYECSGHGSVFLDTLQRSANEIVCECHACFTGPTCAEYLPDCLAAVDSGDPVMYEVFWKQNADIGTLVTLPWYRMSYTSDGTTTTTGSLPALESEIRALHALVGNAVTKDKSFVLSSGSSQMLLAIAQALSINYPGKTSLVGHTPFYELYERQAQMFGNNLYEWVGDATTFGSTAGKNVLEFVTTPNNPTFLPRKPVLNGSHPVFDFAYNWPSMSSVDHAFDEDIMVFTFSKIGGHAGSRLGWAFFRDPEMAKQVRNVLILNSLAISHDSQTRACQILRAVNEVYNRDNGPVPMGLSAARYAAEGRVFHYGRQVLQARYEWIQGILARSSRFSVLKLESEYCAFFDQTLPAAPAYAWVYCNRDEDEDCYNMFLDSGIKTYPGVNYGVTNRYVRFSLFKRDSDYQQLEKYLLVLVAGYSVLHFLGNRQGNRANDNQQDAELYLGIRSHQQPVDRGYFISN